MSSISKSLTEAWEYWKSPVHKDLDRAEQLLEKAASSGEPAAMFWAFMFFDEIGNQERASFHLDSAYEAKYGPAIIRKTTLYVRENGPGNLSEQMMSDLKKASDDGYINAKYLYGQNDYDTLTILGFIPRMIKLRRLKKKIEKELLNNGWSDPKYWG